MCLTVTGSLLGHPIRAEASGSFSTKRILSLSPSRHLASQKSGQSADDVTWEFMIRYSERRLYVFDVAVSLYLQLLEL